MEQNARSGQELEPPHQKGPFLGSYTRDRHCVGSTVVFELPPDFLHESSKPHPILTSVNGLQPKARESLEGFADGFKVVATEELALLES